MVGPMERSRLFQPDPFRRHVGWGNHDGPLTHDVSVEALLLPGVMDSTTDFAAHPEVVADRICLAGRSRL